MAGGSMASLTSGSPFPLPDIVLRQRSAPTMNEALQNPEHGDVIVSMPDQPDQPSRRSPPGTAPRRGPE